MVVVHTEKSVIVVLEEAENEWSDNTEGFIFYLFIYDMRIHKCLPSYVGVFFSSNILSFIFELKKGHKYVNILLKRSRSAMFQVGSAPFGLFRFVFLIWCDEWIVDFFGICYFIHSK